MHQTEANKEGVWQHKPAMIILLALLGFVFFSGLGAILGDTIAKGYGVDLQEMMKAQAEQTLTFAERQGIRWYNVVAHLMGFSVASLIVVAIVKQSKSLSSYLQLDKWPKQTDILAGIGIVLVGFPLIQLVYLMNQALPLPEWMTQMEVQQGWLVAEVLRAESTAEIGMALLVAAIVPAIGEELLFRGLIQARMQQLIADAHLGIWITAAVFSAIHLQFAGFLPRLLLGAFLGYSLWWSKSLWLPILLHFVYNGSQVIAAYFLPEALESEAFEVAPDWTTVLPLGLLSAVGVYVLLRWWSNRRTITIEPE